ncbi:MAG TPA: hypothetical protein VL308_18730 [Gemmatimonadaceae bacterium]|jgi:hypothetical protein|nr:hypothetical protein [Gemmatimonadaceae bacterium]
MSAPFGDDGATPPSPSPLRHSASELTRDRDFVELLERENSEACATEAAEALVADLARRLQRACSHLGDADFAALVLDIARMRVRLAKIDDRWSVVRHGLIPPVDM